VIAQIFLYNNAKDVNTIALKKSASKTDFKKAIDISYKKFCPY
jgi:hypothetical protein